MAVRHLSTGPILGDLGQSLESSTTDSLLQTQPVPNPMISGILDSIPDWQIVEAARKMLLQIHEVSGLPWWASIALSAILIRTTVTLPFSVLQQYNTAKLRNLEPEMKEIVKRLKMEANYACSQGEPENKVRWRYNALVKKEYKELMVRNNCHWGKSIVVMIIQLPVWLSFSVATRNLCSMRPHHDMAAQNTFMELMNGGFGWVSNLAIPDPYFILPLAFGLSNLIVLEVHELMRVQPPKGWERKLHNFLRCFTVATVFIASCLPAAVSIYWTTSSMFGLMQVFLLSSPRVRRLLRIPITSAEFAHPYSHMYKTLRSKLGLGTSK
ncbi:hypothetical protein QAD02_010666 [Eretmocerus hayati]|uniref:Uncharacterized protein n=1 Tax=Eretmocerus hayati TaxID=131215 RepID=A0ACC2NZA3_9HYME|nr:hypothetical protein QAD02_010666 [Eretmocerus hayati]